MESLEEIGKVFILRSCVQGPGFRSDHRKCFKQYGKMAKKSRKYVLKKAMALTNVMVFYGFV